MKIFWSSGGTTLNYFWRLRSLRFLNLYTFCTFSCCFINLFFCFLVGKLSSPLLLLFHVFTDRLSTSHCYFIIFHGLNRFIQLDLFPFLIFFGNLEIFRYYIFFHSLNNLYIIPRRVRYIDFSDNFRRLVFLSRCFSFIFKNKVIFRNFCRVCASLYFNNGRFFSRF